MMASSKSDDLLWLFSSAAQSTSNKCPLQLHNSEGKGALPLDMLETER